MSSSHTSRHTFIGISALLFLGSAALTARWSEAMSAMRGIAMPGGWTLSMAWVRMPGQTWDAAAASFLAMWLAMMTVMMLPSLLPTLWRYHEGVSHSGVKYPGRLAWVVGLGYFFVLTIVGAAVFPVGTALMDLLRREPTLARAVPMAVGVVLLGAGALQFTPWKTHHLVCCRTALNGCHAGAADLSTAWRYGVRLGTHCVACCAGLTASLLVVGIMDLRAMALVTAAITAERLAPRGERTARIVGVVVVAAGSMLVGRAVQL